MDFLRVLGVLAVLLISGLKCFQKAQDRRIGRFGLFLLHEVVGLDLYPAGDDRGGGGAVLCAVAHP
jgi:hypothetical protein